jgi:hypothetical protein
MINDMMGEDEEEIEAEAEEEVEKVFAEVIGQLNLPKKVEPLGRKQQLREDDEDEELALPQAPATTL